MDPKNVKCNTAITESCGSVTLCSLVALEGPPIRLSVLPHLQMGSAQTRYSNSTAHGHCTPPPCGLQTQADLPTRTRTHKHKHEHKHKHPHLHIDTDTHTQRHTKHTRQTRHTGHTRRTRHTKHKARERERERCTSNTDRANHTQQAHRTPNPFRHTHTPHTPNIPHTANTSNTNTQYRLKPHNNAHRTTAARPT